MWVAKHHNVCGNPPCPICYDWHEPGPAQPVVTVGMIKFAQDLLGRAPVNELEEKAVQETADAIHKAGIKSLASDEPEEPPPVADIGMSSARRLEYKLNQQRRKAVAEAPRQVNLDQVFARKAEKEAQDKAAADELQKRASEMRELMGAIQPPPFQPMTIQPQPPPTTRNWSPRERDGNSRPYVDEESSMRARSPAQDDMIQSMPPAFLRMAGKRGWTPSEAWARYWADPATRYDRMSDPEFARRRE